MSVRIGGALLAWALAAPAAFGYIHVPPMTVAKMCKDSHHIRVLKVKKYDLEKGVIVFEVAATLKGEKSPITSFKHVLRPDASGLKPVRDWVKDGKTAVMFSVEGSPNGVVRGIAYVFIDEYCYTLDYTAAGDVWVVIRGEPDLSACYHGSVDRLREIIPDILAGKEVKVPVKERVSKPDTEKRYAEINETILKNHPIPLKK